jgi:hypothetical protein
MVLKPAVEDACSRKSMYAAILRRYELTQENAKVARRFHGTGWPPIAVRSFPFLGTRQP